MVRSELVFPHCRPGACYLIASMMLSETSLFGVKLFASDLDSASTALLGWAHDRQAGVVCVANVDMVTRARTDAGLFSTMQQARLVVSDGMPLVWALRARGFHAAKRVYGPSLMRTLCERAPTQDVSVFLYGGTTSAELAQVVAKLKQLAPRLKIADALCPPMLPAHPPFDAEVVRRINASGARLVFVGLGCPKQEYWMRAHADKVNAIMVGVGLAFAQLAGTSATAPHWMQRMGMEWLFRLVQEPQRLWRRYLIGNSLFLWYCAEAGVKKLFAGARLQG